MNDQSPVRPDGFYPIRTVSQLTGVHPVTLRAWERRYGLVVPARTAKGHRLYTETDVARIRDIVRLLSQGIPVSQVGALLESPARAAMQLSEDGPWKTSVARMVEAARAFDAEALDAIYNDALSLYPFELVSDRLTTPVMEHLGRSWRSLEAGIACEHFFSTFLRNKLGARFHHLNHRASGVPLLAACPAGEHHELGLIQFALAAATQAYRLVLLGADVPPDEIAAAARRARCAAIVLSVSRNARLPNLRRQLDAITTASTVPVLVGGEASRRWADAIIAVGAVPLGDQLGEALAKLREVLS